MRISDWSSDVCSSDLSVRNPSSKQQRSTRFVFAAGHVGDTRTANALSAPPLRGLSRPTRLALNVGRVRRGRVAHLHVGRTVTMHETTHTLSRRPMKSVESGAHGDRKSVV